jgi:hypothetical protein
MTHAKTILSLLNSQDVIAATYGSVIAIHPDSLGKVKTLIKTNRLNNGLHYLPCRLQTAKQLQYAINGGVRINAEITKRGVYYGRTLWQNRTHVCIGRTYWNGNDWQHYREMVLKTRLIEADKAYNLTETRGGAK